MGNVVSKKKSTREILKILDKSITKAENDRKNIIKLQSYSSYRIYSLCFILLIISILYAYLDNQSLLIFSLLPCIFSICLKYLVSIYYNWKLEKVCFDLEDMRDKQKELIDILKTEEDYIQTVELLGKYEDSSLRNTSFSRLTQKKKNVIDTVTDLVLGDDPSKMYALICKECNFHNGMIYPEDDLEEYVCYNCNTRNTRKKKKNKKEE
ncbi:hypothetical protein P3W45_000559 [Vairimorpha bombi]|jgi:hypothetical protein